MTTTLIAAIAAIAAIGTTTGWTIATILALKFKLLSYF